MESNNFPKQCQLRDSRQIILTLSSVEMAKSKKMWDNEPIINTFDKIIDIVYVPEYFNDSTRVDGLSIFAVHNGKIIGERCVEPLNQFLNFMTESHFEKYQAHLKAMIRFSEYSIKTINEWLDHKQTDISVVAHFCGLAIDPKYRGQGLADILVRESIGHLKSSGYKHIVVETTGNGSARIMEKIGGERIGFMAYDAYCTQYAYPLIKDHKGFGIYVINLY